MKKYISIFAIMLMLLLLTPLFSVAPLTDRGGVVISYDDDSRYSVLSRALSESVSLEWYERYTTNDAVLVESSFKRLSSYLPLDNYVFLEEKDDAIGVLSLTDGTFLSFTFKDDVIHAISFT